MGGGAEPPWGSEGCWGAVLQPDPRVPAVHGSLSSVVAALTAERARLEEMRQALDQQHSAPRPGGAGNAGPALRRFHSLSISSDTTLDSFASLHPKQLDTLPAKGQEQQRSNRSIVSLADSHTEFFDACEVFLSASSSENEVCHHPPISACHAESDNFTFRQDMKWKNKFGKSLEVFPVGTVKVQLHKTGDHFEWNKVTTCIHNVLSSPRWIEHYGEVLIRNTRDTSYHCKLTFCKPRPNPMPRDHARNYGFTQFVLELNELTPELRRVLPSTDTRLRPGQRYLEEGNVPAAETQKRQIEQLQRARCRVMEKNNITHQARLFRWLTDTNGKESWVTNNNSLIIHLQNQLKTVNVNIL
ncbi:LOW QUALITY PROTEIN: oxysterol-binding protein-related protein 7-like [Pterocles gutturalis]